MKVNPAVTGLYTAQTAAQTTAPGGFSAAFSAAQARGMDDIFRAAADKYNIPVDLLVAVGKAESNFNPDAVSKCGAQGVMQLMPGTAKYLGVSDAFDVEQNIFGGAKYLAEMLDKFGGDVKLALAAYNAGPGNVSKYGGIPPFKETQNYVAKVMEYAGMGVQAPGTPVASSAPSYYIAPKSEGEQTLSSSMDASLKEYILMQILSMQLDSGWGKKSGNL